MEKLELPIINGVDWGYAENHFTNRNDMIQTMQLFCLGIHKEGEELQLLYSRLEEQDGYKNYCTKIHSLKNSAATVGIFPLSGMAKVMEDAAREGDRETIDALMPVFMKKWYSYQELLKVIMKEDSDKKETSEAEWNAMIERVRTAATDMDIGSLDSLAEEIKQFAVPKQFEEQQQGILDAILGFNIEYLMNL